jgi:hypothetical protein
LFKFDFEGWFGFFLVEIALLFSLIYMITTTEHFTIYTNIGIVGLSMAIITVLIREISEYKKQKK